MSLAQKRSTCEGILEMIDFFSQVMHPELIEEYGYRYIHDILNLEASAIYMVKEPKALYLAQFINVEGLPQSIDLTPQFNELATKVGVVLFEDISVYFQNAKTFDFANFLMPLIVADQLIGFIVAKRSNDWQHEDYTFAEAAKKMVNLAFGTGLQMTENKKFKELMDRRIYDQMLLSHLSKLLLKHLDELELIQAAVDGIRELTASSQTAFFLKDEKTKLLEVKHFSDLKHFNRIVGHMPVISSVPLVKQTYSIKDDHATLLGYFGEEGLKLLAKVGARQLIFLTTDQMVGFVTLGDSVSGEPVSDVVLPLVESIMGSVLIGLENAKQFRLLTQQKQDLAQSLKAMEAISKTMNNLSGASDLTELAELLLMTLVFELGVSSGVVYYKTSDNAYGSYATYGLSQIESGLLDTVKLTENSLCELQSGWLTAYETGTISHYLTDEDGSLQAVFDEHNLLMIGIWPKSLEIGSYPECLFLGINLQKTFSQFERYFAETMIQGVSPLITLLKAKDNKMSHMYQSYTV